MTVQDIDVTVGSFWVHPPGKQPIPLFPIVVGHFRSDADLPKLIPEVIALHYQTHGFDVFEHPKQLTGEAYAIVLRRGAKAMQVGEWLAVKRTRIDPYVKPKDREDLPFIPAARRPGKSVGP